MKFKKHGGLGRGRGCVTADVVAAEAASTVDEVVVEAVSTADEVVAETASTVDDAVVAEAPPLSVLSRGATSLSSGTSV